MLNLDNRRTWFDPLPEPPGIVLIHLSDIHFNSAIAGVADRNRDLRNEIEIRLRQQRTHLHRYDAILVTGDIAFAGRKDEFNLAKQWLDVLCEQLEISKNNVLVTPGNHDVNRAIADRADISVLRERIRAARGEELQAALTRSITDTGGSLYEAIAEYNAFADEFGCGVRPGQPFWQRRFPIGDGIELCIQGMTSTWVCGTGDDDRGFQMAMGEIQCALERAKGVEYLTMAHHPPSWLLDRDVVVPYLDTRARVQLFGHKHEQWIEQLRFGVRVIAGAVHPDRAESKWMPRFNVLTLTVRCEGDSRVLDLVIYPHRWSNEKTKFIPDCEEDLLPVRMFRFELE